MFLAYQDVSLTNCTYEQVYDKIISFAATAGWTHHSGRRKSSQYWGAHGQQTEGWNAGDADWAVLSTNGYGSQNITIALERRVNYIIPQLMQSKAQTYDLVAGDYENGRFAAHLTDVDGGTDNWRIGRHYFGSVASIDPLHTNDNYMIGWCLRKDANNTQLHCFGNDKYLAFIIDIDGNWFSMLHFGTCELFNTSWTYGGFVGHSMATSFQNNNYITLIDTVRLVYGDHSNDDFVSPLNPAAYASYTASYYWYSMQFDHRGYDACTGSSGSNAGADIATLINEPELNQNQASGVLNRLFDQYSSEDQKYPLLSQNAFSGKRPMVKQVFFPHGIVASGDSNTNPIPIGMSPCYLINFTGLTPGDTIYYGSDGYKVFPIGPASRELFGVAFHISQGATTTTTTTTTSV